MPRIKQGSEVSVAMLRAFVTLAGSLNLTDASERLGTTRQTVRRHIAGLERIKGQALFSLGKQGYELTAFGQDSLSDARSILRQIHTWSHQSNLTRRSSKWLEQAYLVDGDGCEYFSQQHSVSEIGVNGLPIMKKALAAWGQACTQIESAEMTEVRPFLVIYRRTPGGWIFTEIGERSAYAQWFGWAWAKSTIGRLSQEDNVGDVFNDMIAGAYERIYGEGGARLDHLYAHLRREGGGRPVPVGFQRLLMGCVFPDGTPALAVLAVITDQIEISALEGKDIRAVPDGFATGIEL